MRFVSHYQCPVAAGETRVACEGGKNGIMPTNLGAHPHFHDRGALKWYTSLSEGLAAAKAERKKVFIEYGRAG